MIPSVRSLLDDYRWNLLRLLGSYADFTFFFTDRMIPSVRSLLDDYRWNLLRLLSVGCGFTGGEVTCRLSVGMIPPVHSLLDDYRRN